MKKYILYIFTLVLAASCVKDSRLNFVEPDHIGFAGTEPVEQTTVCSGRYMTGIIKSGRNLSPAKVTLKVDPDTLTVYNAAHGTAYKALDPAKYSISNLSLDFLASDSRITSEITWNPEELITAVTDDNFVIPIKVSCDDPSMLARNRNLLIVNIRPSSIGFVSNQVEYTETKDRNAVSNLSVTAALTKANPRDPVTVECAIDESLVRVFQDETSYYYNLPPEGCITLVNDSVTIAPGDKQATFKVLVNEEALAPVHGGHVIPFKLTSVSMKGLPITQDITYLIIKPNF